MTFHGIHFRQKEIHDKNVCMTVWGNYQCDEGNGEKNKFDNRESTID